MTSFTPGDPGDDFAPAYETDLGLNETLRIYGVGYFYDPEFEVWQRGDCPDHIAYDLFLTLPLRMSAVTIHEWMQAGVPVLPYEVAP